MHKNIAKSAVAGAVILGAAGAALVLPKATQAADPSAAPTASASTPSAGGSQPDTDTGHRGGFGADDLTAAANALGMTEADVTTALGGGQTLAQIAASKGVSVDTLINAMVAAETTEINDAVKAGTMTQAEADQRIADLKAHETAEVNGTFVGGRGGHGADGTGPDDQPAPSASTGTGSSNG